MDIMGTLLLIDGGISKVWRCADDTGIKSSYTMESFSALSTCI